MAKGRSAEHTVAIGFAIALLGLCVLGGVAYWSDGHLRDDASAARRAEQAIDAARIVSERSVEAESAVRAYMLTGDASFLPPLTTAVVAADADLAVLRVRMADGAGERLRWEALARAFRDQLSELRGAADARGRVGPAESANGIERARGPRAEVARLAREIEDSEDVSQGARDADAARVSAFTLRVVGVGMISAFLLVAAALYLLRRDFAGARRARAAFLESHRELEGRVRQRTGQLANIVETLRSSEERFRQIAENIAEVFWVTDPTNSTILYVSPAYEKVWGRSCASLYAAPADWLEAILPEDRARVARAAQGRARDGAYEESYRITRPDGTVRWIHDRAFPVRDPDGGVTRVVGLASDITKERSLEEQFRQAQKMEAVGRLAGGVAHDFNNILAVILGYGAMLRADLGDGDARAADVDEICKAGRRATELTRQLLLFCRQEMMEPRVLDLNEAVAGLRRMVERVIGEDVQLATDRTRATWRVHADPSHLDQIILNLVVNARDAMPRGGTLTFETANVTLDERFRSAYLPAKPGEYVMLSVSDTGYGMDAATQARIFEPFFTTKERGKGTGLGLSTVFGVVQRSGGTLNVRSQPGQGTTFELYLPRVEGEVAMPSAALVRDDTACRGRVLVVDDDDAVGKVAARSLSRLGYEVVGADGPERALEIVATAGEKFDLLLTDVVMPKLGGPALAERVLAIHPGIKVLYMSGYADDGVARSGVAENGATFVPKPFTPALLASKVAAVLKG